MTNRDENAKLQYQKSKEFWKNEVIRGNLLWPDGFVIRFVKRNFSLQTDKKIKIIDFGCGLGRHSLALAKEGYDVIALDYNQEVLDIVEEKKRAEGIDSITCLCNKENEIPVKENSVDCIISSGSMYVAMYDDIHQILVNMKKSIKRDGLFWADWRTVNDGMYQKEKGQNYVLADDTGRGGSAYYFADEDGLRRIYQEAGWEIVSLDVFGYTEGNGAKRCEWYHVVAKPQ